MRHSVSPHFRTNQSDMPDLSTPNLLDHPSPPLTDHNNVTVQS
jgi:hypothetical protein